MAQSPEYPDLLWLPPRSWTDANRSSVQLVVIHTTEGAARALAAADGAAYDQRRTDGTSTHFFHDSGATVQCVRTADVAHTARRQGNLRGIHHELCTRAGSANWADAYHHTMLLRAAKQAARDARKWGIPVRHLTAAQVAAGEKGFCGHNDITRAFPQDNGTHTDPGASFPWTQFLNMVRAELKEDDMALNAGDLEQIEAIVARYVGDVVPRYDAAGKLVPTTDGNPKMTAASALGYLGRDMGFLKATLGQLAGKDFTDEPAIIAGVLAGLPPEVIVAAIPDELAEQVADELGARLSRPADGA